MSVLINKRTIIVSIIVIMLGFWVAGSIILGVEYFNLKKKVDSNDAKAVINKLSKIMDVPQEEPLVATITDAARLKEQEPFYKNAQNGDKVIIWKEKAVIYRLETNKIIDFGVVIRAQQNQTQQNKNANEPSSQIQNTVNNNEKSAQ